MNGSIQLSPESDENDKTLWEFLGIERTATDQEIIAAWRAIEEKYPPIPYHLRRAFEVLINQEERFYYRQQIVYRDDRQPIRIAPADFENARCQFGYRLLKLVPHPSDHTLYDVRCMGLAELMQVDAALAQRNRATPTAPSASQPNPHAVGSVPARQAMTKRSFFHRLNDALTKQRAPNAITNLLATAFGLLALLVFLVNIRHVVAAVKQYIHNL